MRSQRIWQVFVLLLCSLTAFTQTREAQKPPRESKQPQQSAPAQAVPPPTSPAPTQPAAEEEEKPAGPWAGLVWRSIGPHIGGRALTATGVPNDPNTYYFGAVAGGVWKTNDGGNTWRPIADKANITSVGSIAVADSDPNVIYVGTGEACPRGNIVEGDGVYKSTDAGKNWTHIGLRETRHIGKVLVHPKNHDVVLVAALGNVYAPNAERGVYRSTDGGKTWQRTLFRDEQTGAIDIAFDPTNPNIVFAALWQAHRKPWIAESGGPGSGLYRSADGGVTWKRLDGKGLPKGILGRIGVAVSPANGNRVWALIEAKEGGLYRSDDGGENWQRTTGDHRFTQRAWYYMHVTADPKNVDTVYILNTGMFRSTDGGKDFTGIPGPHGDYHHLWIAPDDPKRMIFADDGGAAISVNGGQTWSTQENQPTSQFYHVTVDNAFPYRVYGAQQDNSTISVPSRVPFGAIGKSEWYSVGGCESGYIAPDPRDNNIVYAGCYGGHITRWDKRTGQRHEINAWPVNPIGWAVGDMKHRYQWTAPIVISPHNPDVVYHAAEVLFRTDNGGMSWTAISPDLTRNDKSKQQSSGGPLTKDNTSVEYYNTIFTVAESPKQKDLIWAGTDDGLIHITRDGGKNWTNVTPKDMPEWGTVSLIEASPHEAGVAYAAVKRYRLSDWEPYIFRTADFGKTWTQITNGIPMGSYVHAVREAPAKRGLLFAGTETGVFVSFNDGANWESIRSNMPQVQISDLVVKDNDVVVGTHGRSFWILDDITPLRQHQAEPMQAAAHVYPASGYRIRGGGGAPSLTEGQNAPAGVVIYYRLKDALGNEKKGGEQAEAKPDEAKPSPLTLEILDSSGKVVRKFPPPQPAEAPADDGEGPPQRPPSLPMKAGLNRFVWNMRTEDTTRVPGAVMWAGNTRGPMVLPGQYEVRLTVDGKTFRAPLELKADPRVKTSAADMQAHFDFLMQIQKRVGEAHQAVNEIREVRRQAQDLTKRLKDTPSGKAIADAAKALDGKMTPVEEELLQVKSKSGQDPLNYPIKLNNQIAALFGVVESGDTAPTKQAQDAFAYLSGLLDKQLSAWRQVKAAEVAAFNEAAKKEQVPAVIVPASRDK